jgi:hypothetical protein
MILLRRYAVVAASMVIVVAIGVTGAGKASASESPTYAYLCVQQSSTSLEYCALAQGSNAVDMTPLDLSYLTNWYYPTSGYGEISQANTNECMQLDNADGNIVREATCIGDAAEEWEPFGSYGQWRSKWDASLCLTFDLDAENLDAGGCGVGYTWYQDIFPVPTVGG